VKLFNDGALKIRYFLIHQRIWRKAVSILDEHVSDATESKLNSLTFKLLHNKGALKITLH
jgi:hypothetical protein